MSGVREATADTAAEWAKVRRYGRGGVRRVSCLWSRVAACAPPPKTQNGKSHIERQPTEDRTAPVLVRFSLQIREHRPRRAVWTPRRNSQHDPNRANRDWREPREPRGADDENRSGRHSTSGHRNPCAPPADRHMPHCHLYCT